MAQVILNIWYFWQGGQCVDIKFVNIKYFLVLERQVSGSNSFALVF